MGRNPGLFFVRSCGDHVISISSGPDRIDIDVKRRVGRKQGRPMANDETQSCCNKSVRPKRTSKIGSMFIYEMHRPAYMKASEDGSYDNVWDFTLLTLSRKAEGIGTIYADRTRTMLRDRARERLRERVDEKLDEKLGVSSPAADRRSGGTAVKADPKFDAQAEEAIPAEVRMISGCHDTQTSADVGNVATFQLPGKFQLTFVVIIIIFCYFDIFYIRRIANILKMRQGRRVVRSRLQCCLSSTRRRNHQHRI